MKIHQLTVEEALISLHTTAAGLSSAEAQKRLLEFGPNRVEPIPGDSLVYRFARTFIHFFALILWIAAGLAFVAEYCDPGTGMATLGIAILGVILVNGLFSFWQEYRAERALAALQKLLPHQVKVLRDDKAHQIPAENVVPGDIILLDDGDDVPADCRVIEAFGVRVNTATVTGESVPQARDVRPSNEEELLHSRNILLAGTSIVTGQAKALVFATGMHTVFGTIAHLTQRARPVLSPLQQEIARLSRLIGLFSIGLGVGFFWIGQALHLPFWTNFIFAIGIIVANVPEGLLPTVTLALALGSQRMARRNALIRHLPSVETLGAATVICTDKTGTLTENRMEVKQLFLAGQVYPITATEHFAEWKRDFRRFFEASLCCQNLRETEEAGVKTLLGDPMEVALVRMAEQVLPEPVEYPRVDEIPFDTDRKRLTSVHQTPQGRLLFSKGALEALLPLCSKIQTGAEEQALTADWQKKLLQTQDALAKDGLRVLAIAYRAVSEGYDPLHLEEGLTLAGLVALEDPHRPEVPAAIRKCKNAGIKIIMVTGDHPKTALAVARQIGISEKNHPIVITGDQLRQLSNTQLQLALNAEEILFARVGADQKMRIVEALQAKKHVVAVTGDGVNDAPALRRADIGIAMGIMGTDVAREAADMVLLDDNFASIVAAIEEGRTVFGNIKKFLTYILTHNVAELVPYLAFVLFRIPLPLTVIQILAIDLGTDTLPALALGAELPDPKVMQQPPRSQNERLLSWGLLMRAYLFLGVIEATAAMSAFFFVLLGGGWQYGQSLAWDAPLYLQATTACLTAIIIMQVANIFLCRSERQALWSFRFFENHWILAGIVTELALILLIDYTAVGHRIFGTAPLPGIVWLFVIPFAIAMVVLEEFRKWLLRRAFTQKYESAGDGACGAPIELILPGVVEPCSSAK